MAVIFAVIFGGLSTMGTFMTLGSIPDSKAVTGAQLSEGTKQKLIDAGIVGENETIKYFYSEDLFSFVNYGNLFTDKRVVSYEIDDGTNERAIYSAAYNEITNIEIEQSENFLDDSTIQVYENDEFSFMLVVSTEENGDEAFFNELNKTWTANLRVKQPVDVIENGQPNNERIDFSESAF